MLQKHFCAKCNLRFFDHLYFLVNSPLSSCMVKTKWCNVVEINSSTSAASVKVYRVLLDCTIPCKMNFPKVEERTWYWLQKPNYFQKIPCQKMMRDAESSATAPEWLRLSDWKSKEKNVKLSWSVQCEGRDVRWNSAWCETGAFPWRAACVTKHWLVGQMACAAYHRFTPNSVSPHLPPFVLQK